MSAEGSYRSLNRNIHVLFVARIINRFGDFVQMLLVLILTISIGMEEHVAGLFTTLTIVAASLGQFLCVFIADRYPRKYLMVICQLVVAVCYLLCSLFIGQFPLLVVFLILFSSPFRGATWPISNALIADFTDGEIERARAFSLLYLGSNIGVAVGPLVAAFLFYRNLSLMFLVATLTLLISASLLGAYLPKPRVIKVASTATLFAKKIEALSSWIFTKRFLLIYIVAFSCYNFIYVQHSFTLPLHMNSLFGPKIGTERFGWLMSVNALTVLLMTTVLTRITLKNSRSINMALGIFFYVVGFGLYAGCTSFHAFLGATFIWTLGEILLATNGNVFINQHAPTAHRGKFNSIVSVTTGIGSMLGPLAGGLLLAHVSYKTLWTIMVGLAVIIGVMFVWLRSLVLQSEKKSNLGI